MVKQKAVWSVAMRGFLTAAMWDVSRVGAKAVPWVVL